MVLSRLLQYYLTATVAEVPTSQSATLSETVEQSEDVTRTLNRTVAESRIDLFENHLLHVFPRNSLDRRKLIECGYSERLWEQV